MDPEPPTTQRREVVEERHGEEIVDPYRWLEGDADDPEIADWTERQNAYADDVLDLPAVAHLRERFDDLARVADHGPVRPAGDRYFQQVRAADEDQPVLYVRDEPGTIGDGDSTGTDGLGRVLEDPNEREGVVSVDWFVPDPDGDLVAYGVAEGGQEQYDVHVVDAATGETVDVLEDAGRGVGIGGLAWTEDGFYYCWTAGLGDGGQLEKEIRFHELGADPDTDRLVTDDVGEQTWPVLETDGDVLLVQFFHGWERSDVSALRADPVAGDELELTPVLSGYDAVFEPTLSEGTVFVTTDYEAPHSRVVAADVETFLAGDVDPADLRTVVPEGEAILRDVTVAGDVLLVHHHLNAHSRLTIYEREGGERGRVDLPDYSSVSGIHGTTDAPTAFFTVESFTAPPQVRRADLREGSTETLFEQAGGLATDVEVTQEWFESADGTEVPAFVVRRADLELAGDHPTVLTGYGGFQVNRTPTYDRFRAPFLEAGGVFVLATLRGGEEFGQPWHEAGRRERKQNVFDDAIAVAEGLCDRGYTSPDRLAVTGGSNGGLLVGALLTQRPDLWAATLCRVPLLDMLRFHRFLLGASWTSEYGSPDDPEAFAYLRAYSPYHNVAAADYPPTLFTTAEGDTRVHPGHARKMTARLQERSTGDAPVALRVEDEAGHGVGKPTSMLVREQAEQWGFLAHYTGATFD